MRIEMYEKRLKSVKKINFSQKHGNSLYITWGRDNFYDYQVKLYI